MPIKHYKPTSPGIRHRTGAAFDEITKSEPEKSLTEYLSRSGGRNNNGRITTRHHGGGHRRLYRMVDFYRRDKLGVPATVVAVEYDPNRSCRIALVQYADAAQERRYIIAPVGLQVGDTIMTEASAEVKVGNMLALRNIPEGMSIHNLELFPGRGGQVVRSAGTAASIQAKEGDTALVKLPSTEIRRFHLDCFATIGQVGNVEHNTLSIGKAGRNRWLGIRPTVRGVAMNPHDHPHGGGEGKSGQGNPHPVSNWGQPNKGFKTRKKRKYSDRFIVKRRS